LTELEIQSRIESSSQTQLLEIDGVKLRYAFMSQRGYYPEAPDKDNQDAYVVIPQFGADKENQAFFGVFDGHGKDGHYCARYARDNLPRAIADKFAKIPSGNFNSKSIKQALSIAHNTTNDAMHADATFDDSLSGTTSISVLFRERTMYISNVGDSRAVIVSHTDDDRLVAKPLSSDQTPYRKDERERCKKYGARIMSMDQIEGLEPIHENWGDLNLGEAIDEGGDPPRIWSPKGDYPGTAFTRSLGDCVAEECGVVAEPEILEREIQPQDKFIIIASDGVFEFLTNQMAADMVARYADPLEACKAIVNAAYNMWLQYEVRTDDITAIIFYIDEVAKHSTVFNSTSSFFTGAEEKGALSPSVKRVSLSASVIGSDTLPSVASNGGPLSVEIPTVGGGTKPTLQGGTSPMNSAKGINSQTVAVDEIVLEARPVRRTMSREKRKHMISMMSSGQDEDGEEMKAADAELTEEEMHRLMTSKNEAEDLVISSAMRSNFLFHHLNSAQRAAVVGVMQPVFVNKGDWIIKQGAAGDKFYVVDTGRFEVRVKPPTLPNPPMSSSLTNINNLTDKEKEEIAGNVVHVYESGVEQHPGFGELSLMYGKPRAASVFALTDGKLWSLDRRIFKRVVLRPKDHRRDILKVLKKVELFKALNLNQLQRLIDLMSESHYSAGERIIRQGDLGDTFYVIVRGSCECSIDTIDPTTKAVKESKVVMELKENSYFGERALLESKPRAANVTAKTVTDVLFIDKAAFEEVLGPLADIIAADRERREALAMAKITSPQTMEEVELLGVIVADSLGPFLLATNRKAQAEEKKSVSIRSLTFSDIAKNAMQASAQRCLEATKFLQQCQMTSVNSAYIHSLVPPVISSIRQSNALHLVFETALVSDLSSFIRAHAAALSELRGEPLTDPQTGEIFQGGDYITYIFACIVMALESLHTLGIVYRAVQPEALYLDTFGRVVFVDYRFARLGLYPGGSTKAFTICGASDYLSPEQIAQTGHSYPVDLWGMGVLLYELTVGSHPFSSNTEVATYAKISTFGTKANPALKFPDHFPTDTKALINQLLVPTPEARIGSGQNGFAQLKKHPFFHGFNKWDSLTAADPIAFIENYISESGSSSPVFADSMRSSDPSGTKNNINMSLFRTAVTKKLTVSPLRDVVLGERNEIVEEGMDTQLLDSFGQAYSGNLEWLKSLEF
jgi:serine/threonine protein phosphatase PrpC/CRP-like cAMP-binding protein